MLKKLGLASAIALVAGTVFATGAFARPPRVIVGGGFGWGGGPYWGGYYGGYYPYYGGVYVSPPPTTGELKIDSPGFLKQDSVFVDGGYVGTAKQVKSLHLAPGTHEVELRGANNAPAFQDTVSIELGHTTSIHPFGNG